MPLGWGRLRKSGRAIIVQEFKEELERNECYSCPSDPCVFVYAPKDDSGKTSVEGCLGIHVDDGIGGF